MVDGTPSLPKLGKDKKIIIPIAVVAIGYIGWRYYQASQGSGQDVAAADAGDFGDGSSIPSVIGAVSPDNSYGSGGGDSGNTTQTGQPTTNAEWTNLVAEKLSASDSWSYTDIVSALGNYLNSRPLSTQQQQIVQAAIAVGGYPPVGSHSIIPGGDTAITVAPTGLKAGTVTANSVTLVFGAVAGAAGYRAYRGVGSNVGSSVGPSLTVSGLQPNTSYTFNVAAVTASGASGPHSAPVTVKTKTVTLGKPSTPRVTAITKTSAHVSTNKVPNATGYDWWINGVAHGSSDGPAYTVTGLKSRTSYRLNVLADTATSGPGPKSDTRTFKTK